MNIVASNLKRAMENIQYKASSMPYGGGDSSGMTCDGKYVYWSNDNSADNIKLFLVNRKSITGFKNINIANLFEPYKSGRSYVKLLNRVMLFENINVTNPCCGSIQGKQSFEGINNINMDFKTPYVATFNNTPGYFLVDGNNYAPVTFSGLTGFWLLKCSELVSSKNIAGETAKATYCGASYGGKTMILELRDYKTLSVKKTIYFTPPTSGYKPSISPAFGAEGMLGGFEVAGNLVISCGERFFCIDTNTGNVVWDFNTSFYGDSFQDFCFDYDHNLFISDSGDANSEQLYINLIDENFDAGSIIPQPKYAVIDDSIRQGKGYGFFVKVDDTPLPTDIKNLSSDGITYYKYEICRLGR